MILDEAYCEYNTLDDPDASLDLLKKHPNLVLLRTFSKVYGLCGLRVGYALCGSDAFVTAVNQVRQPFFCNAAAQAAAVESLKHGDAVAGAGRARDRRAAGARGRAAASWASRPRRRRPTSRGSTCRRATARSPARPSADRRGLTERGVLVRSGAALGRPGALRVTYGTPEQNARFLGVLRELL